MTRRLFLAFGLVVLAVLVLIRSADPVGVRYAREVYFDSLQQLAPRPAGNFPVRVVDIDEASLAKIGQWPWPRDILAKLASRLWDFGAAAIVFDVLFSEPDRLSPDLIASELDRRGVNPGSGAIRTLDNDAIFAAAIQGHQVVLGTALVAEGKNDVVTPKTGFVEIGDTPSSGVPQVRNTSPILEPLARAATGIGMVSVSPGRETDIVRTVPLAWATPEGLMPALSVEALRVALGQSTLFLDGANGAPGLVTDVKVGDYSIPTTPDGQIWVRYRHDTPDLYVSASEVLDGSLPPAKAADLQGAIVFVGTSSAGLLDIHNTALGESVPGVSIHAQIVEQILAGDFLYRNGLVGLTEIAVLLVLGVLLILSFVIGGPIASVVTGTISGAAVLAASWVLFSTKGVLLDATFPMAAGLVMYALLTAYQFIVADRDKRRIRRSFSHYVSTDVLREIESRGNLLELGGLSREATVLFADIRNFTPMSEGMDPAALVSLLNQLFTALGEQILSQRGTIDKFIGDAVMAFWNAPLDQPDHARRALLAALGMRKALAAFNHGDGKPQVSLAIGMTSGQVLVGNIGSRDRFNYSAVGDAVNRASRIETACRHVDYDVLTSTFTAAAAGDLAMLDAGRLELKGVSERLPVSIVVGGPDLAASEPFKRLVAEHTALIHAVESDPNTAANLLGACAALAQEIDPGLGRFYARILQRSADFADVTAP